MTADPGVSSAPLFGSPDSSGKGVELLSVPLQLTLWNVDEAIQEYLEVRRRWESGKADRLEVLEAVRSVADFSKSVVRATQHELVLADRWA